MNRVYAAGMVLAFLLISTGEGLSCPACSDLLVPSKEGQIAQGEWSLSAFWVTEQERVITYLRNNVTQRLELGVGFGWGSNLDVFVSAKWLGVSEGTTRPEVSLGLATTGVKETEMAIYAVAAKTLSRTRLYAGLQIPLKDPEPKLISGGTYFVSDQISLSLLYEGVQDVAHFRLGITPDDFDIGVWVLDVFDRAELGLSVRHAL